MAHVDEYGRDMDEPVTVTLPRKAWWLVRNQLLNQADDWRRDARMPRMAGKIEAVAGQIQALALAAPAEDNA
jgi:hypothetical protein